MAWRHCSSVVFTSGAEGATPAPFTRMSMVAEGGARVLEQRPHRRRIGHVGGEGDGLDPAAAASRATASISARVRAASATCAPAAARSRAMARPIPRPPPVTSALRPASPGIVYM